MNFLKLHFFTKNQSIFFKTILVYIFLFLLTLFYFLDSIFSIYFNKNLLILLILIILLAGFSIFYLLKCSSYEIVILLTYIALVILFDFLLMDNMESNEKMLIYLYFLAIYFILFEKMNKLLSTSAIIFLILYVSCKSLTIYKIPIEMSTNALLIILQISNIFISKIHKKQKSLKTHVSISDELWERVFNDAFPGLVFIFKKTNIQKNVFPSKLSNANNSRNNSIQTNLNSNEIDISFINQKAQNQYKISNYTDFLFFLEDIIYLKEFNKQKSVDVASNINNASQVKSLKDDILIHLMESINSNELNLEGFHHVISGDSGFMGYHKSKDMKMRLFITGFRRDDSMENILFIDDNQFEEDYCALKELDEKKDKMLISITHDLRSPLNGILAFINLAKNELDAEARNKKLILAEINGNLLMSLIEDILDFQSIAQNKFSLKTEEFSLNKVLQEIIDLITIQTKEKNINFKLHTNFSSNSTNINLFSDSRRLKQILLNLLSNSIKFTMNGGKLTLNVFGTKNPSLLKFEIMDTGIGIKPEIIEKLGEPFNTFDTNGLNKYGIGFGLYLCKKLSTLLGPKEKNFYISSIYGKGSKIGFLIYTRISEPENKTLSLKKFFNQFSEYSLNNKALTTEYEKLKKNNSKNTNSRTDMFKRSLFSKPAFSSHDFDVKSPVFQSQQIFQSADRRYSVMSGKNQVIEKNEESQLQKKFSEKARFKSTIGVEKGILGIKSRSEEKKKSKNNCIAHEIEIIRNLENFTFNSNDNEKNSSEKKSFSPNCDISNQNGCKDNHKLNLINDDNFPVLQNVDELTDENIVENMKVHRFIPVNQKYGMNQISTFKSSVEDIIKIKDSSTFDESVTFTPFSEEIFNEAAIVEENEDEISNESSLTSDRCFNKLNKYNFETKRRHMSTFSFQIKKPVSSDRIPSERHLLHPVIANKFMIDSIETPFINSMAHYLTLIKCNVLLVDDNTFNLLVLMEFLKRIPGYELNIEKASNGAECLQIYKNNNHRKNSNNLDIIFMDCYMPIMDGYVTSTEIKRLVYEEKYIDVFIIAVTGLSGWEEENKCKMYGMDDFIMKPVFEKELTELFTFYMKDYKSYDDSQ